MSVDICLRQLNLVSVSIQQIRTELQEVKSQNSCYHQPTLKVAEIPIAHCLQVI